LLLRKTAKSVSAYMKRMINILGVKPLMKAIAT
jgi:hypothetical protein